jgi:hypothetical protein
MDQEHPIVVNVEVENMIIYLEKLNVKVFDFPTKEQNDRALINAWVATNFLQTSKVAKEESLKREKSEKILRSISFKASNSMPNSTWEFIPLQCFPPTKKNHASRKMSFFVAPVETKEDVSIPVSKPAWVPYVNNHMGIPFKFEMMEFRLRNMTVHAQGFLNTTKNENEDYAFNAIKLREITMDYKQLMGQPDSSPSKGNVISRKKLDIVFEVRMYT